VPKGTPRSGAAVIAPGIGGRQVSADKGALIAIGSSVMLLWNNLLELRIVAIAFSSVNKPVLAWTINDCRTMLSFVSFQEETCSHRKTLNFKR
jgi:hypothetical protein